MATPQIVRPGDRMSASWANDVVHSLRNLRGGRKKNRTIKLGGSSSLPCPFGQLTSIVHEDGTSTKGIKGGYISCGDKNFNVADYDLGSEIANGSKIIYISVPFEANRDDDGEIFLPGVKTSSKESILAGDWTIDSEYPDNTELSVETGTATIILPIGSFTVTEGKVKNFVPSGCGSFRIDQCAGTYWFQRISYYDGY